MYEIKLNALVKCFFPPKNYKFNLPLDSNCYTFVGKRCRLRGTIELLSVSLSVKDSITLYKLTSIGT